MIEYLKQIFSEGVIMNKISIIGTGSVGSTIAYSLAILGMASEIVMIDINSEKALGEALDIRQGPFLQSLLDLCRQLSRRGRLEHRHSHIGNCKKTGTIAP